MQSELAAFTANPENMEDRRCEMHTIWIVCHLSFIGLGGLCKQGTCALTMKCFVRNVLGCVLQLRSPAVLLSSSFVLDSCEEQPK
jgi:hypothetical protein